MSLRNLRRDLDRERAKAISSFDVKRACCSVGVYFRFPSMFSPSHSLAPRTPSGSAGHARSDLSPQRPLRDSMPAMNHVSNSWRAKTTRHSLWLATFFRRSSSSGPIFAGQSSSPSASRSTKIAAQSGSMSASFTHRSISPGFMNLSRLTLLGSTMTVPRGTTLKISFGSAFSSPSPSTAQIKRGSMSLGILTGSALWGAVRQQLAHPHELASIIKPFSHRLSRNFARLADPRLAVLE